MKKTSKKKTIVLITLLSILSVLLLGFMIAGIYGVIPVFSFNTSNLEVSSHLAYEKVYDQEFQKISVDVSLGDIEVLPSSDDNVHVLIYSEDDLFKLEDTTSTLSVVFREEKGFHFSWSRKKDFVKIFVPQDSIMSFQFTSDCGDVIVDEFSNATFDVTANMGDISIDKATNIDIESDLGDVNIGEVRTLIATLSLGDLEVSSISEYLSIESDLGKISLDKVSLTKDSSITLSLGDLDINHLSNTYVDAKTDLGDIDILDNDREAPYTLTIKNDLGDVSIG